jgi:hypothetical protein
VECLDCRLIREAELESAVPAAAAPGAAPALGRPGGDPPGGDASGGGAARGPGGGGTPGRQGSDPALAAEVARALEKVLGRR